MKDDVRKPAPALAVSQDDPVPDQTDYRTIARFRSALREFLFTSGQILKKAGVTTLQYHAMVEIRVFRSQWGADINIGQLASQMRLRHNTAVSLIDGLEAQGHVQRSRSAKDSRVKDIRLTPKGSEKLRELAAEHREQLSYMQSVFTDIFAPRP
jgi:DNA-binding MarR family transcriptional regulator